MKPDRMKIIFALLPPASLLAAGLALQFAAFRSQPTPVASASRQTRETVAAISEAAISPLAEKLTSRAPARAQETRTIITAAQPAELPAQSGASPTITLSPPPAQPRATDIYGSILQRIESSRRTTR